MSKPRTYELKDDTPGSRAKYILNLERADGEPRFVMDIFTDPEEIYHDAMREKILQPEAHMRLTFSQREMLRFATIMVEGVSKHLEAVRQQLYRSAVLDDEIALESSNFRVSLRAHSAKTNYIGRQKNSARLVFIITRKEDKQEMMVLRLKRNRIVWFLQTLREMFLTLPKLAIPTDSLDAGRQLLVRHGEYIAIGAIWLHGRELQKFQDYIERVIFDFTYNTGDGTELFRYRQIRAGFSELENVVKISLTKYTHEHRVYKDEKGERTELSFLVTSNVVARLFLLLPLFYAKRKEVEVLHLPQPESQAQIDTVQVDTDVSAVSDTEEITEPERESDFLLNMIETQLALNVDKENAFNVKRGIGKVSLFARYRDGVLNDETYVVRRSNKLGEIEDSKLLPIAQFSLGLHWINIFAIIAESMHNKQGEGTNDFGRIVRRWKFRGPKRNGENDLFIAKTVYSEGNKALVLVIDNYTEREDEYTGISESLHHGRMRIPFFREHIRSLMKGLVRVAQLFDGYYFTRVIDVYDSEADSFIKRSFGIRRSLKKEDGGEVEQVFIGSVAAGERFSGLVLCDADRDHLKKSAYYRLLYGRWLPFVGEEIALSFDGFLSDMEFEYSLEFDRTTTQGGGGSVSALAILFSTVSFLNPENDVDALLDIEMLGQEGAA